MSLVGISKIVVEDNIRIIPGVEDLSSVDFKDLPPEMQAEIKEVAATIKDHGLMNPVTVKEMKAGKYRLIAGWRRFMAHKFLGKTMIDVKSIKGKREDEAVLRLIENVHRKDLNPMEIAHTLDKIRKDKGLKTQDSLAKYAKLSPSFVSQHLALLAADPQVQKAVENEQLGMGGARAIASLPKEKQAEAIKEAEKEAKKAGDVSQTTGKPRIKTKGARRQARRQKKPTGKKMKPVAEREKEQKKELIAGFFADEFGQKKASKAQKTLVTKFWDHLMEKGRLVIK